MRIRLAWLFLRSRLAGWCTLGLGIVSMLFAIWCFIYASIGDIPIIATVTVPLLMATLIVGTTKGPFGETERSASQSLVPLRVGQLTGMLLIASGGLSAGALFWTGDGASEVLSRNLLGLVGVGLLAALPLGASVAWVAPTTLAFFAIFGSQDRAAEYDYTALWSWPARAGDDRVAVSLAAVLIVAGLLAYSRPSFRETVDDTY